MVEMQQFLVRRLYKRPAFLYVLDHASGCVRFQHEITSSRFGPETNIQIRKRCVRLPWVTSALEGPPATTRHEVRNTLCTVH